MIRRLILVLTWPWTGEVRRHAAEREARMRLRQDLRGGRA